MAVEVADLNGGPAIVFRGAGRVIGTLSLDLDDDGQIAAIHNVANPDKLHAIADGTIYQVGPGQHAGRATR